MASETVLTPSVGRKLYQSEPERLSRGPVLFSDQVIPASERLSDGLHRILVGAEEWASALERFLFFSFSLSLSFFLSFSTFATSSQVSFRRH